MISVVAEIDGVRFRSEFLEIDRAEFVSEYGLGADTIALTLPYALVRDRTPRLLTAAGSKEDVVSVRFEINDPADDSADIEQIDFMGILDPVVNAIELPVTPTSQVQISARSMLALVLDDGFNAERRFSEDVEFTNTPWSKIVRDMVQSLGFTGTKIEATDELAGDDVDGAKVYVPAGKSPREVLEDAVSATGYFVDTDGIDFVFRRERKDARPFGPLIVDPKEAYGPVSRFQYSEELLTELDLRYPAGILPGSSLRVKMLGGFEPISGTYYIVRCMHTLTSVNKGSSGFVLEQDLPDLRGGQQ